jgi:drug/metabolite transporter (DMT)-like permease
VIFVIQPSFSNFGVFAFYPLGKALSFALDMLVTPNLSKYMDSVPLLLHKAVFGTIICLAGLICGPLFAVEQLKYIKPVGIYWIWPFSVGLFATISHIMMTVALRYAPLAKLAPLHYLEKFMSGFFGCWGFSDVPNGLALCGMMTIIMSSIYIFIREQMINKSTKF